MKILKTNGNLLIDLPQFDNIKDAVMHCVLNEINLRGADLRGAKTQYCYRFGHFSKIGGRCCLYYKPIETEPIYIIMAGCFSGTLDKFEEACKDTYPNDPVQAYEAQIAYLRTILK